MPNDDTIPESTTWAEAEWQRQLDQDLARENEIPEGAI